MRRRSKLWLFSICSLLLIGSAAAVAAGQAVTPTVTPTSPQILTSGTGEAKLTPDRATVYIGTQTRATTAAAAARENAQRQTAIINAIVAAGVPRAQIGTENYSVAPDTRYDQATQKTTVNGYVVSNVVRVELERIDQVSAVIDASLAKGANQINSLDFYASNADSARREALGKAVARARADAEAIAHAAGGSLGPLIEVSSSENAPRPVFRAAMAADALQTPIEPGQQRIQVSISARWAFEPNRK